jgi:hypothetical protein
MFRIVVLTLFTAALARAQPAKTLPGGAVLKPERPVPVRPLGPAPDKNAPDKNAPGELPAALQPLAPLLGSFTGTTKSGAKVSAQCLSAAAATWIRCDVAVESSRPSTSPAAQGRLDKAAALVAIGWDERGKFFHAFVGDSSGKSSIYKGHLKGQKLVLSGPDRLTLDLTNPQQPVVSTVSEVVTLAHDR